MSVLFIHENLRVARQIADKVPKEATHTNVQKLAAREGECPFQIGPLNQKFRLPLDREVCCESLCVCVCVRFLFDYSTIITKSYIYSVSWSGRESERQILKMDKVMFVVPLWFFRKNKWSFCFY